MKRLFPLLIAICLTALTMVACGESAAEKEKRLEERRRKTEAHKIAQVQWKDLSFRDTVQVGDTNTYNFVFYNTGWKPVTMTKATPNHPGCSCSLPGEVPVGEQDTVKLHCAFKSAGSVGVNIMVEHTTPQQDFLLILISDVQE